MAKLNCRWRKGAERYSTSRTVERHRWVRDRSGGKRLKSDKPNEPIFCSGVRELPPWRHGARVASINTTQGNT